MFTHSQPAAGTTQSGNATQTTPAPQSNTPTTPTTQASVAGKEGVSSSSLSLSGIAEPVDSQVSSPTSSRPQSSSTPFRPGHVAEAPQAKKAVHMSSIFGKDKQKAVSQTTEKPSETVSDVEVKKSSVIDATSLVVAWRELTSDSQLFDKAAMGRLGSLEPTFVDQTHFKFIVANQNVEAFLRGQKDVILRGMRSRLGVSTLDFTTEQIQSEGPQKLLSPREQVMEMEKINSSFGKLREALGLEL